MFDKNSTEMRLLVGLRAGGAVKIFKKSLYGTRGTTHWVNMKRSLADYMLTGLGVAVTGIGLVWGGSELVQLAQKHSEIGRKEVAAKNQQLQARFEKGEIPVEGLEEVVLHSKYNHFWDSEDGKYSIKRDFFHRNIIIVCECSQPASAQWRPFYRIGEMTVEEAAALVKKIKDKKKSEEITGVRKTSSFVIRKKTQNTGFRPNNFKRFVSCNPDYSRTIVRSS